ncbi:hypothetical protein ACIPL1_01160 [Pseudomonas sp. NPDC090202]|uniref:hypothetical protein n=1 Tax=unclassified Pseudomonas TaxID=196821 RepID=UPI0037F16E03
MNSFLRGLAIFLLGGVLSIGLLSLGLVQAGEPVAPLQLAAGANNQPDNGVIRQVNPNSQQGTRSTAPTMRGPYLGPPQTRQPTLENGGIGNGYPTRQQAPRPSSGNERRSN